jgi:hypothetical protein
MSIIDAVVAAVTPPESEETRLEARAKARASAAQGDWLSTVLDHHEQVEAAFAAFKVGTTSRSTAHEPRVPGQAEAYRGSRRPPRLRGGK